MKMTMVNWGLKELLCFATANNSFQVGENNWRMENNANIANLTNAVAVAILDL